MGGRKKKGPQPDFVFLSYAPNRTETDQVAQESQRRAHAARKSHAAARQRRYDDIRSSIASSVVKQPSNSLGESTSASESPEEYSGEDEAVSSSLMYKDENASHVTKDDNNSVHQMFYHTSRPMKFLGQGHIDPFDTFASKGLPAYVYEVLHIAAETKWSNLKPSTSGQQTNPLKQAWLRANVESPTVLHSMVYGMLRSLESTKSCPFTGENLTLKHQTYALASLQKDLQELGGRKPHENLLLAIVSLAAHGELLNDEFASPPGYIESPLARTQNLHIYGLMKMVPEHGKAILAILEQLGGVEALTLIGLRETLEFYDLVFATRFGVAPRIPYHYPVHPLIPDIRYLPDHIAEGLLSQSGSSLLNLKALDFEYMEIIEKCGVLLAGLDQYHRAAYSAPSLPSLIRARLTVHHKLASLPPTENSSSVTTDQQVIELCRIVLLIFSNMVFFPLPQISGVNERLVVRLRYTLDDINPVLWVRHRELMTWVLMIGGIASSPTVFRFWFVYTFHSRLCWYVDEWEEVKNILETHVWWDHICLDPALVFWREVHDLFGSPAPDTTSLPWHVRSRSDEFTSEENSPDVSGSVELGR